MRAPTPGIPPTEIVVSLLVFPPRWRGSQAPLRGSDLLELSVQRLSTLRLIGNRNKLWVRMSCESVISLIRPPIFTLIYLKDTLGFIHRLRELQNRSVVSHLEIFSLISLLWQNYQRQSGDYAFPLNQLHYISTEGHVASHSLNGMEGIP